MSATPCRDRRDAQGFTPAIRARHRPVQTIAVGGVKGGVGRSTIAANLAVTLARRGIDTLLLDACYAEGGAARSMGMSPSTSVDSVLKGDAELASLLNDGPEGLKVIASSFGDIELSRLSQFDHATLIALLSQLQVDADTLIVDTPAGLTDASLTYASAAREVLLVITGEQTSIEATAMAMRELNSRYRRRRFRILVNRVESASHGREVFGELVRELGDDIDVLLDHVASIPEDERFSEAGETHQTVVLGHPRSAAALAITKLAERVARWARPSSPSGHIEFYVERLVQAAGPHLVRATA